MTHPIVEAAARRISERRRFHRQHEDEFAEQAAQMADHIAAKSLVAEVLRLAREPSAGMSSEGSDAVEANEESTRDSYGSYSWVNYTEAANASYKAMIDALLREVEG